MPPSWNLKLLAIGTSHTSKQSEDFKHLHSIFYVTLSRQQEDRQISVFIVKQYGHETLV